MSKQLYLWISAAILIIAALGRLAFAQETYSKKYESGLDIRYQQNASPKTYVKIRIYGNFLINNRYADLAHLTEHMLLTKGSKKYPEDLSFLNAMRESRVQRNASTALSYSDYVFEIPNNIAQETAFNIVEHITSPLFLPQHIDKEMPPYIAEAAGQKKDESYAFRKCFRPDLISAPSIDDPMKHWDSTELSKDMRAFYQQTVVPKNIIMTISSALPLSTFEGAISLLSSIPNSPNLDTIHPQIKDEARLCDLDTKKKWLIIPLGSMSISHKSLFLFDQFARFSEKGSLLERLKNTADIDNLYITTIDLTKEDHFMIIGLHFKSPEAASKHFNTALSHVYAFTQEMSQRFPEYLIDKERVENAIGFGQYSPNWYLQRASLDDVTYESQASVPWVKKIFHTISKGVELIQKLNFPNITSQTKITYTLPAPIIIPSIVKIPVDIKKQVPIVDEATHFVYEPVEHRGLISRTKVYFWVGLSSDLASTPKHIQVIVDEFNQSELKKKLSKQYGEVSLGLTDALLSVSIEDYSSLIEQDTQLVCDWIKQAILRHSSSTPLMQTKMQVTAFLNTNKPVLVVGEIDAIAAKKLQVMIQQYFPIVNNQLEKDISYSNKVLLRKEITCPSNKMAVIYPGDDTQLFNEYGARLMFDVAFAKPLRRAMRFGGTQNYWFSSELAGGIETKMRIIFVFDKEFDSKNAINILKDTITLSMSREKMRDSFDQQKNILLEDLMSDKRYYRNALTYYDNAMEYDSRSFKTFDQTINYIRQISFEDFYNEIHQILNLETNTPVLCIKGEIQN